MPTGLGDEQLWLSATNDNTGTSTAFQDQSGNGNNGTASGTLVVADTSEGGSFAYQFDGTNDDIDCSNAVTFTSNLVSVSTWINGTLPTTDGVYRALVSKGNASGETPFDLSFRGTGSGTNLRFFTFGGGSVQGIASYVTAMSSSQWHHVCGTYDNQTFRLYVDGVEVATAAWTGGLYDNSQDILIGSVSINGVAQRYFDGMQDDVRIYTRALTQSEITHLASQRGIEGPPPVGLGDEVAWICPTLNSGGVADISGSGHDGTLESGASIVSDVAEGGTQAMSLTGSIGGCLTLDSSILPVIQDGRSVTYSCWYKNPSAGNEMIGFSTKAGGSNGWYVGKESTAGGSITLLKARAGSVTAESANLGSDITGWSHLAWTIDGSGVVTGYQNGVAASIGAIGTAGTSALIAYIGSNSSTFASAHYQDDCRLYNRVLTQSEITHLAEARGIEGPPPVGLGDEQLWLCPSLNDSANDISGNGNDGTYNGGMGTIANTGSGGSRAYEINSTSKYIDCGNILDAPSEFTISLWFYRTTSDPGGLVSKWSGSGGYMIFNASTPTAASNGSPYAAGNSAPLNTWEHIAATYDGTDLKVYQNGVETSSIADTAPLSTSDNFLVGRYLTTTCRSQYDDIRAYTRALTQAEITHLATSRGIEGSPTFTGLGDEQLWLCPSLDDSADDISGYGNDGTYQGGMGTVADTSNGGSLAYQFDGVNDYIDCGSSASLDKTSDDPVSQSGWVKVVDTTTTQFILLPKSLGGGSYTGTHLTIKSGLLSLRLISSLNSNELRIETGTTLTTGWHHIAFSYDGSLSSSGVSIYLDGASQSLSAITSTLVTGSPVTYVGGSMLASTRSSLDFTPDNGTLQDDLRLFNRTLTQSEITHLATSRGIEGSPSTPTAQYNAFITHAFKQLFQTRLR